MHVQVEDGGIPLRRSSLVWKWPQASATVNFPARSCWALINVGLMSSSGGWYAPLHSIGGSRRMSND